MRPRFLLSPPALPRNSPLRRCPRGHIPFLSLRTGLPQTSGGAFCLPQPNCFEWQKRFFALCIMVLKKIKKSLPLIVNYFFNWYGVPIRIDWYPRLPFMPLCENMYRYD
ncbi:hypothetical protein [Desulfovibrio desulfuricans]|uniref:hypothetical protein n=1 Tax=Desulfovibrio desulfuricans TaxID=876 RepID=UPI00131B00A0|nr:hypothetical protein [Desulfovibrio desulfuricans]